MIGRETRVLLRHYLEQGMSKAAVARLVGVNRRTVHRWIASGQLDRDVDEERVRCGPRRPRPSKFDFYKEIVRVRLEAYSGSQRGAAVRGDPGGGLRGAATTR